MFLKRKKYCNHWKSLLNYKTITFIDEKPFQIGDVPNQQNVRVYRHQSEKKYCTSIETEKFSTKVHTFCCINWYGKSDVRIYVEYIF